MYGTYLCCSKVFAFDKDIKRVSTLNTMTLRAGASCVKVIHKDFLRVDPADSQYRDVKYILVDPSCSGSGLFIIIIYLQRCLDW